MEGRGNLEFVAPFPVPGSRRSHGRVRHIAHIPKCQFRTPVSEALTMNNFFFAAEARTPSRPVRFPGVGWIRAGRLLRRAWLEIHVLVIWGAGWVKRIALGTVTVYISNSPSRRGSCAEFCETCLVVGHPVKRKVITGRVGKVVKPSTLQALPNLVGVRRKKFRPVLQVRIEDEAIPRRFGTRVCRAAHRDVQENELHQHTNVFHNLLLSLFFELPGYSKDVQKSMER